MNETLSPPPPEVTDIPMAGDRRGLYLPEHLAEPHGSNSGNIVNINNNPNINVGQQNINSTGGTESAPGGSSPSASPEAPRTTVIPVEVVSTPPTGGETTAPAAPAAETAPTPEPGPTAPEAPGDDNEIITDGYPKSAEWTPLHGDEPHKVQVVGEYKNKLNGETMYKISSPNLEGMENHPIPKSELNFDAESGKEGDSELKEQIRELIEQLKEANKRIRKLENDVARANGEPLPNPDEDVDDRPEREPGLFTFTREVVGKPFEWDAKVGDTVHVKRGNGFERDWKITNIEAGQDGKGTITASKEGEEDIVESSDTFIKWAIMDDLLDDDERLTPEPITDPEPEPEPEPEPPEPGEALSRRRRAWNRARNFMLWPAQRFDLWRQSRNEEVEDTRRNRIGLAAAALLISAGAVGIELIEHLLMAKGHLAGPSGLAQHLREHSPDHTTLVGPEHTTIVGPEHTTVVGPEHTASAGPDHTTFYNAELGNHGVGVEMPHGWQMHGTPGEYTLTGDGGVNIPLGWDEQGNLSHATREVLNNTPGLELHQDQVDYINSLGQKATHYMTEITEK